MSDLALSGPAPASYRPPFRPFDGLQRLWWRAFPPKSGLESWAERELARIGDDDMQRMMNKHLLRMIRTFSREGHTGFSAGYAVSMLERLLRFEPVTPLTGDDSEWNDISDMSGEPQWQNNRCSRVFRGADGRAYDIDGRVFEEPNGCRFTGRGSRVFVTFPYTPTTIYVPVGEDGEPLEGPSREELAAQGD
jgi:hypothetical protein